MNSLAPICVFVYNRPKHTSNTLTALQNNLLASSSDLFVFCDGPKNITNLEEVNSINETRSVVKNLKGFKSITIIETEHNKGLSQSIINGITKIVNKYGTVIVIEDDILTSPYFLTYCNEALDFYKEENKVLAISGYRFPVKGKMPSSFFLRTGAVWGWATWQRAWNKFNFNGEFLLNEIKVNKLEYEFDFCNSYDYVKLLEAHNLNKVNSWDICWQASIFIQNGVTLFPGISFTKNIGQDGTGTHYNDKTKNKNIEFTLCDSFNCVQTIKNSFSFNISIDKKVYKSHCAYFKYLSGKDLFTKTKGRIANIMNRFNIRTKL